MHSEAVPAGAPFPRLLDVAAAGIGLLLLSPLFLVVAMVIRMGSPGPVFHRAQRAGRDGVPFLLYKFRSMRQDADHTGSGITSSSDDRITTVGRWLRRFKIDELPQLVNVFRGEMSVIGPRPEDPRYLAYYPESLRGVLHLTPGITSAASLAFRNESALLAADDHERDYIERILPEKLRIDLAYFSKARLHDHLLLIVKTIVASLRP